MKRLNRTVCPTNVFKEIYMKKLHSLAFCAFITPTLTLGASSVLAQQPTGQEYDRQQQTQPERGDQQRRPGQTEMQRPGQTGAQGAADRQRTGDQAGMPGRGFMSSVPAQGIQASDLIGTNVRNAGDENLGSVDDLIIDQNGQVVAIIVGVGGFLGIGQRNVAISWDEVTKSGAADDLELRVDMTRDRLRDAPEFERRN
jgi:sporulation protein YlmC with PRC-barrel domain